MAQDEKGPRWSRNSQLAEYLNVSDMTIWRWQRDRSLNFPQPSIINGLPYTSLDEIDSWMKARIVSRVEQGFGLANMSRLKQSEESKSQREVR
jgi:predicted DNA-binding transcriptional regulator AlpA